MNLAEQYRLSEYQDLGGLNGEEGPRLKRNRISGTICVEKHVSLQAADVYAFLADHPDSHIPRIYEHIPTQDYLIVIEEYVEGETLEAAMCREVFALPRAVYVIHELCEALRPLHEARPPLICRDLKPGNIMIASDGSIKIIDFDIARIYEPGKTRDTRLLGTREYAAPEQYGYRQTDPRTDIYAMGVLLNEMLTGKLPAEELAEGRAGKIIKKCIHMDPDRRYQTVMELDAALPALKNSAAAARPKAARKTGGGIRSYLPPGFRTGTWWKTVIAVCGYLYLVWISFTLDMAYPPAGPLWLEKAEQMLFLVLQLVCIGILFNYRGWRDRLPLVKSRNIGIRMLGFVLLEAVQISITALLATVAELLFL